MTLIILVIKNARMELMIQIIIFAIINMNQKKALLIMKY